MEYCVKKRERFRKAVTGNVAVSVTHTPWHIEELSHSSSASLEMSAFPTLETNSASVHANKIPLRESWRYVIAARASVGRGQAMEWVEPNEHAAHPQRRQ